ncbi:hypothetical protein CGG93_24475, partial [Vibrio parahaemolyticus]
LKIDLTKQDFLKEYEFEKVFSSVKMRLLSKNIYLNRTTLEGCLIQINSSKIFYEWMKKENNINFEPILCRISKSKFVTEDMLIDYMRIIYNGKSKALTDYSHFNLESYTQAMNNGKKINGKLRYTSRHAKLLMDLLEKSTIRNKGLEKTDGWATSFINFSVDYIEDKSLTEKQSFGSIFKIYFPELYDIIRMLQP